MKLTWSFGAFELDRLIRHSWTSVKERSMTMPRPQFTPQQRAFLVTEYARANSVTEVLQHFRGQYPNTRCPARITVYRNLEKYRNQGKSQNLNKGHSGRPRTGRSRHNIKAVRHRLDEARQNGERVSSRRNGTGMPHATFNRITRMALQMHPYQMNRRHQLLPGDFPRREQFCNWLFERPDRFLDDLTMGDEAAFGLNASLNTHYVRLYAPKGQKPIDFDYQKPDNRQKLTVWIGLIGNGTIIGPFFFRQNVNGDTYLDMINNQVVPFLEGIPRFQRQQNGQFRHLWWGQDGTPAHRRRAVTEHLGEL